MVTYRVQDKQKNAYATRWRVAAHFKVGDEDLVNKPSRKVGRSEELLHRWRGPYVVVRKNVVVELRGKIATGADIRNHTRGQHGKICKRVANGGGWVQLRSERSRKQPKSYGNPITFSPFVLFLTLLCGAIPCVASPRKGLYWME